MELTPSHIANIRLNPIPLGWPIKPKMWKINNVPIGCGSIGIDEQETLKKYIVSIKIQPALSAYIIQRKYKKIQRKNPMFNKSHFLRRKPSFEHFWDIGLLSLGLYASFDTHIVINIFWLVIMKCASNIIEYVIIGIYDINDTRHLTFAMY